MCYWHGLQQWTMCYRTTDKHYNLHQLIHGRSSTYINHYNNCGSIMHRHTSPGTLTESSITVNNRARHNLGH
jgi:hypothetical protein